MAQQARPAGAKVRKRNHAYMGTLVAVACTMVAASGCSSDKSSDPKAAPSATATAKKPSAKPADPAEAAKVEAIATYKRYWEEMQHLYADSHNNFAGLTKFAAGPALEGAKTDAKGMHDKGNLITGTVVVGRPTVTTIDVDRKIPNAVISSCLDITRWKVVKATTNKAVPLPSERLTKYLVVSTVERWPEGWRVIKDEPQGKPC
ncbi:hypothetical protein [Streptomyces drozdowiczii]|uniref:Secreted protein/lipoprotein n=1 Tax=Streptomyces drozdowiczii TaxID=202862 RepID=A0ABY6Q205_9ACTN|nr:hypothetical protein [Streptomyces drozdowiczii]MCX0247997.1 hypothetical protein [Streptomyces drozdowiczii]UZK58259.1 hypothetical protein NEH16_33010 [Streptomyces drozdowiczii]